MVIMSTLLRLLGDASQSNTEVRNSFKEPVLIKADSQIALTGVSAQLKPFDVPANSVMQVGAGAGANYKQVGARITQGSYTSYGFAKEAELAFNYPIVDTSSVSVLQSQLLGVDEKITIDKGYLNVETRKTSMANVVLDDWLSTFDDPFEISGNSFVATDISGGVTVLSSPNRIPRLSSKITATFVNPLSSDAGLKVVDFDDGDYSYWGVHTPGTLGSANWYLIKGPDASYDYLDTGIQCSDGDTLTMYQYGGVVTIVVGTETYVSPAGWVPRSVLDRNLQTLSYQVFAETDGEISNIQATELDGPDLAANLKNEVTMKAGIQFKNLAGVNQPELADYFGFPRDFNKIPYSGNPAILVAGSPMQAIPNWLGVIVCLEGIGLLKSFDGSKDTKSPSNILYVINELKGINNESLQIDFPSPIYLNLKNGQDVNISDLRIRMLESSGFNPIKFDGKPSFTLVVRERRGAK